MGYGKHDEAVGAKTLMRKAPKTRVHAERHFLSLDTQRQESYAPYGA